MIDITIHIFKGICHIGLGILALNQYKNKKITGWLLIGIAFLLQLYEILFLNTLFPNYIYEILMAVQAILSITGVILLINNYRKNKAV